MTTVSGEFLVHALSVIALVVGVVLAASLSVRPTGSRRLEGLAGWLIVCGLSLLGAGLPLFQ